jgi:hypothetical protein
MVRVVVKDSTSTTTAYVARSLTAAAPVGPHSNRMDQSACRCAPRIALITGPTVTTAAELPAGSAESW